MRIYGFEQYGGPEVEAFLYVPEPPTSEPGLMVRTTAVGLNPADIKVRAGQRVGKVPVRFPMAMGREAAGTVLRDPSSIFQPGDRVFGSCVSGWGALGDLTVLDPAQTALIPDGVTPQEAAVVPVAIGTAWDALHELRVGPSDTLLVLGAGGGVGIHATQLARHLGATVIAAVRPSKHDLLTTVGATPVDTTHDWCRQVTQNAPRGITAIIDTAGGELLTQAASLLREHSRLRSTASPAQAKQLGGSGVTRRRDAAVYSELTALIADGSLTPVITHTLPFQRTPEATQAISTGPSCGKTVINL